jgi:hypothetical protein
MSTLDARLEPILLAIVRAYQVERDGRRQPLMHIRMGGMREDFKHYAWPDDGPPVGRQELEELADAGAIRIEHLERSWMVAPTRDAIASAAQYERELARARSPEAVDISWAAVRPVLHALVAIWERHGASPSASVSIAAVARDLQRSPDDLELARALELLEEDAWVTAEYELGTDGPLSARPLPKALAGVRGWPGGDDQAAGERLITALDELAAREPDEEKRKHLGRVRDFVIDLGSKTLSELGGKLAGDAL